MGRARKWVGRDLGLFGCFGGRDRWLPCVDEKSRLAGCDRRFEPELAEDIITEGGGCARLWVSVWASVSKGLVAMYGIRPEAWQTDTEGKATNYKVTRARLAN